MVLIGTGRVFWLSPMLMKIATKAAKRRPVPSALNPFLFIYISEKNMLSNISKSCLYFITQTFFFLLKNFNT